MKNRIQKWGNSLAFRVPRSFARQLSWGENTPVAISLDEDALVIRTDRERAWDLETLLQGVAEENIPSINEDEGASAKASQGTDEDVR